MSILVCFSHDDAVARYNAIAHHDKSWLLYAYLPERLHTAAMRMCFNRIKSPVLYTIRDADLTAEICAWCVWQHPRWLRNLPERFRTLEYRAPNTHTTLASADVCPICLGVDGPFIELFCGHVIHGQCIEELFKRLQFLCPLCRRDIQ